MFKGRINKKLRTSKIIDKLLLKENLKEEINSYI